MSNPSLGLPELLIICGLTLVCCGLPLAAALGAAVYYFVRRQAGQARE